MKIKVAAKKSIVRIIVTVFLVVNGAGYISAYIMTHYKGANGFSLGIPRPKNYNSPQDFDLSYTTHKISIDRDNWLDSWLIKSSSNESQGIVVLFHGKDNNKSSLLDSATIFNRLNYDVLLVDFRGSGQSSGNKTTIGVEEAKDVVTAVRYLEQLKLQKPVILYGISMGSAAILRAIAKHDLQPDGIILELPFTSLLDAAKTRLRNSAIPPFPLAEALVFWGGIQHGFNGFKHNPVDDAKLVNCPTLILVGERDRTTTIGEVKELYQNLDTPKNMVIFPEAGHEILARNNSELWSKTVNDFLISELE